MPPKRRRGTNIGLMLLKTETVTNPAVMLFHLTLDGDLLFGDFRQRVGAAVQSFDRFTSKVVDGHFVDDGTFLIDDHVHEVTAAQLGGTPTQLTLRAFLESRFTQPLDVAKPMWEMILIRGYRADGSAASTAQSVVIARIHHVIVDGTAAMRCGGQALGRT